MDKETNPNLPPVVSKTYTPLNTMNGLEENERIQRRLKLFNIASPHVLF